MKKIKLAEIGEIVGGSTPSTKNSENYDGNIAWITPKDLANYNKIFIESGERSITEKGFNSCSAKILPRNSILFTSRAPIGYVAITKKELCTNQGFKSIIPNDKIYYLFLYYLLKYNKDYIASFGSGTTFKEISGKVMKSIEIVIPDRLEIQKKIAYILFNIDKKIELNNQINDNLYKFAINYLNNKKEETEVPIRNFAKIQGGYAFKSKDLIDNKTKNRIIKIKNLRSELNADVINSQFVEDKVIISLDSKFKLRTSDVTIAMTGAELGKTGFIYGFDNYYLNQRVGVIRGNNKEKELYLKILFLSDKFQSLLNSKGYGSAQSNISSSDIENILVNDITEVNLKDIYENLNSVYNRIISNCEENLNLERLQGSLLPKLMNGEIDLDKLEI